MNKNLIKTSLLSLAISTVPASAATTFAFNTNGDTEGFTGVDISGLTVSDGLLKGTVTSGDPRLELASASNTATPILSKLSTETWDTVVFRVREIDTTTSNSVATYNTAGLAAVFNTNNNGLAAGNRTIVGGGNFSASDVGGGFFEVTVNISTVTGDNLRYFRLDPVGNASNGNAIEVDFIQVNAVPEPSAVLLGALGALCLLRRRR